VTRTVKLSRLEPVLSALDYPIARSEAADALDDVIVLLADGEVALGPIVDRLASETFRSAEDVELELFSHLPIAAVGEPGQSEGDA
jgi:hypothetical protein